LISNTATIPSNEGSYLGSSITVTGSVPVIQFDSVPVFSVNTSTTITVNSATVLLTCQSPLADASTVSNAITVWGGFVGANTQNNTNQGSWKLTSPFNPYRNVNDLTTATATTTWGIALPFGNTVGNWFSVATNRKVNLGTGDFTIEFWCLHLVQTSNGSFFGWSGSGAVPPTTPANGGMAMISAAGVITIQSRWGTTSVGTSVSTLGVLNGTNGATWVHFSWVRNNSRSTVFLNGGAVPGLNNISDTNNYITTGTLYIGSYLTNAGLRGAIHGFRVTQGVALYSTGTNTPSLGTSVIWPYFRPDAAPVTTSTNKSANLINFNGSYSISGDGTAANSGWTIPGSGDFNLSSGAFTVEAWVYLHALASYTIISQGEAVWRMAISGTGNLVWTFNVSSVQTSASVITAQTWNHVAVVCLGTGASNNVTLYVNGLIQTGSTGALQPPSNNSSIIYIGRNPNGPTWFLDGYISNVRVVKGVAIYTDSFRVPDAPLGTTSTGITGVSWSDSSYTVLLTANSATITDSSVYNRSITTVGSLPSISRSPFGNSLPMISIPPLGGSVYFDGATYATLSQPALGDVFTIEFWAYHESAQSGKYYYAGSGAAGLIIGYSSGNLAAGHQSATWAVTASTVPSKGWNHIALVRRGTGTGQFQLFLNGTQAAVGTDATTFGAQTAYIGYTSNPITGYISNFRIVNNQALYPASIVVPTSTLSLVPNTAILTAHTNPATQSVSSNYTGQMGSATYSGVAGPNSVNPFGPTGASGASIYFQGGVVYLNDYGPTNLSSTGTNATAECWFYATALPSTNDAYIIRKDQNSQYSWGFTLTTTGQLRYQQGISQTGASMTSYIDYTISINTWYHIAMSRTSTYVSVFVNGICLYHSIPAETITDGGADFQIGSVSYLGYISNVRVVKGTAVYQGNFTPSTTPLTAITNTNILTMQGDYIDYSTSSISLSVTGVANSATTMSPWGWAPSILFATASTLTEASAYNHTVGYVGSLALVGRYSPADEHTSMLIFQTSTSFVDRGINNLTVTAVNTGTIIYKTISPFGSEPNLLTLQTSTGFTDASLNAHEITTVGAPFTEGSFGPWGNEAAVLVATSSTHIDASVNAYSISVNGSTININNLSYINTVTNLGNASPGGYGSVGGGLDPINNYEGRYFPDFLVAGTDLYNINHYNSNTTGVSLGYYGGGGNGGGAQPGNATGSIRGGGGSGAAPGNAPGTTIAINAGNGIINTGGGGGGGGNMPPAASVPQGNTGLGGSGIIIVRYPWFY
jgi:hypothetical protein